jgi:hypothetical protein
MRRKQEALKLSMATETVELDHVSDRMFREQCDVTIKN